MDGKTLERMREEFTELHERRVKCAQFIDTYLYDCVHNFKEIPPETHSEFNDLCEQLKSMQQYELTLVKRILRHE